MLLLDDSLLTTVMKVDFVLLLVATKKVQNSLKKELVLRNFVKLSRH